MILFLNDEKKYCTFFGKMENRKKFGNMRDLDSRPPAFLADTLSHWVKVIVSSSVVAISIVLPHPIDIARLDVDKN